MVERRGPNRARRALPRVSLLVLVGACAALIGASAASAVPPPNDSFASAQDVSLTPTSTGSNAEATAEAGEPDHGDPNNIAPLGPCAIGVSADGAVNPAFWGVDENPPLHSAWFKWTAPATGGCLTVDTFGSSFDTVMSVYTGTGYGSLTLIAGNDDYKLPCAVGALGVPATSQESCVRFNSIPGTTYYIAIDSGANKFGGGGSGSFALNWSLPPSPMPDLAVSKSTTATTVNAGEPIPYTIQVTNQGSASAPGSTLADTLTGATITSMSTNQGSCTAPACSLGTIGAGQTVTVTLIATASAAGTVNNSATAATTAPETSLANNLGAATPVTVNAPKPDLTVTKSTTATSVNTGQPISYRVTVINQGSASAPNVTLTDTPAGAMITSMSPSQGSCTSPACSLGPVAAGSSATVTVVLTASMPGTVSNSATATTTAAESNADNNTGTASDVTVTAPLSGCTAVGKVQGDGHWKFVDARGKKKDVHVEFEGECRFDKKTQAVFLQHAEFHIDGDDAAPKVGAKTDGHHSDVATLTITGSDAIATGMYNGQLFRVTMHDGRQHGDEMRAQYGAFDTGVLNLDRVEVHIDH